MIVSCLYMQVLELLYRGARVGWLDKIELGMGLFSDIQYLIFYKACYVKKYVRL